MKRDEILAVFRAEWRSYIRSGMLWKLTGGHLLVITAVTLASWPSVTTVSTGTSALTWNWFSYVLLTSLIYVALAVAADVFEMSERIPSYEWVYYGVALPFNVLVGRASAVLLLALVLSAITLPISFVAYAAAPLPGIQVYGGALVTTTMVVCAIAAGLIISAISTERSFRLIGMLTVMAVLGLLSLVVGGWIGPTGEAGVAGLNPLGAMYLFLKVDRDVAETLEFPWGGWIALYGIILGALFGIAYARLRRWLPEPDGAARRAGRGRMLESTNQSQNTRSGGEPL